MKTMPHWLIHHTLTSPACPLPHSCAVLGTAPTHPGGRRPGGAAGPQRPPAGFSTAGTVRQDAGASHAAASQQQATQPEAAGPGRPPAQGHWLEQPAAQRVSDCMATLQCHYASVCDCAIAAMRLCWEALSDGMWPLPACFDHMLVHHISVLILFF